MSTPISSAPELTTLDAPGTAPVVTSSSNATNAASETSRNLDLGIVSAPTLSQDPISTIPKEDLWTLIRRMNRQLYHVKVIESPPPGTLDLNVADREPFSPDKMRANVERLYTTVFVGMVAFAKHIIRLRSWNEKSRTTAFCCAYFLAWLLNLVVPLLVGTLLALVAHPPSRAYLFPPVRLSKNASHIVAETTTLDGKTAGSTDFPPQLTPADIDASPDSLTGTPEARRGEAVEQEARHFVTNFVALIVGTATGRSDRGVGSVPMETETERTHVHQGHNKAPEDPPRTAIGAKQATVVGSADKTKEPLEAVIQEQLRPIMHILGDIADNWERAANALSPTPPFDNTLTQQRFAAIVAPLFLFSLFIPAAVVVRATTFILGAAFFGQPYIDRALGFLNLFYPGWKNMLHLRNNIFIGVPTNAQLALTLLRLAEANNAPIPAPPAADTSAPSPISPASAGSSDLGVLSMDETTLETAPKPKSKRKRAGLKVAGLLQKTARAGVSAVVGVDRIRASVGHEPAKNRIGVLSTQNQSQAENEDEDDDESDGEYVDEQDAVTEFPARWKGKKGVVTISTVGTTPCVAFCKEKSGGDVLEPLWTVALADILELKKVGGFGWKGEMFLQMALGMEVADGVEIVARRNTVDEKLSEDGNEETFILTALQQRDELFNRLLALGGHKWEAW